MRLVGNAFDEYGGGFSGSAASSYAPEMHYNDGDGKANGIVNGTHITDDDAFSERTSLRLNIGLGPARLYQPPIERVSLSQNRRPRKRC